MNQSKTRRIDLNCFDDMVLDKVKELINIFQKIYPNDIWVTEVWFLKKKQKNDGFKRFHFDYDSMKGGHNVVSTTIVVNLGVFHLEDEEEEEEDNEEEEEEESEYEESNNESVGEGVLFASSNSPDQPERMMPADKIQFLNRIITDKDELKIKRNYSRSDKNRLEKGRLYASDFERYVDFLQNRDDEKCLKDIKEKPSLFYDVTFIKFDKHCQPHYKESK